MPNLEPILHITSDAGAIVTVNPPATDLTPLRMDSSGVPVYRHQVSDDMDPAVQAKLDSWFSSELEGYDLADVKALGRAVI